MATHDRNETRGRRLLNLGMALSGIGGFVALGGAAWLILWKLPSHTWDLRALLWPEITIVLGLALFIIGLRVNAQGVRDCRLRPATFFTADEEAAVMEAIRQAELATSAEIRVHLHDHVDDVMSEAKQTFERLGMTATEQRNGVLFFIATRDHRLAVLGDRGIDEHVESDYWDGLVRGVQKRFHDGEVAPGLTDAIADVAARLAAHFPRAADDVNELPDDISRN